MPEQTRLDVLDLERLLKQWVVLQVQHTQTKVHTGMEIAIRQLQLLFGEGLVLDSRSSHSPRGEVSDLEVFGGCARHVCNDSGQLYGDQKRRVRSFSRS